ncbi:MAG: bifunctional phosphoglucose/phosphomannose isomerase [Chloroflexota bacterium]
MSGLSGGVLDDVAAIARTDRSGMLVQVATLPAQVREAWTRSRALDLPGRHSQATSVALLGTGPAGIWGDLVAGIWSDRLKLPLAVVRGYDLPAWVGPDTLVVAGSWSGSTEETLGAVEAAFQRRCPVAVIAGGGPLASVAERVSLPLLKLPTTGRARSVVGAGVTLLAGALERAGALPLADDEVEAAAAEADAALAAWGPDVPTEGNAAKQLAWALVDRIPVVVGSGALAAVARRWKTQLNENAKTTAFWDELPEASHNTVAGFPRPDSALDHELMVLLSSPSDHPRTTLRAELTTELLEEAGIAFQSVVLDGPSRFAQALRGIVLGDLVSAYLGVLQGVDPTPVDATARLEDAMKDPGDTPDEGTSDPFDDDSDPA